MLIILFLSKNIQNTYQLQCQIAQRWVMTQILGTQFAIGINPPWQIWLNPLKFISLQIKLYVRQVYIPFSFCHCPFIRFHHVFLSNLAKNTTKILHKMADEMQRHGVICGDICNRKWFRTMTFFLFVYVFRLFSINVAYYYIKTWFIRHKQM